MKNYVPHPRYGSQPITSGHVYSKDEIESAHWRYASLKYFPETAIPAEAEKQNYAEYSRKLYVDIEESCKGCQREFIFFALEQKYWFEELKFWVDSHCIKCINCRKRDFEIKQMQVKYVKKTNLRGPYYCDASNPPITQASEKCVVIMKGKGTTSGTLH